MEYRYNKLNEYLKIKYGEKVLKTAIKLIKASKASNA